MTVVIIVLALVVLFLLAMLGTASVKANGALAEVRQLRADNHTTCILTVQQAISADHDAALLRHLADKWESVEEQGNLRILAREQYNPGGPSIPTIWLRQQADLITERTSA